jgi:hypothetical protein
MLMLVLMFVVSASITETNLAGQPGFGEEFECAVDSSLAHTGIFQLHESVEVFIGEMLFAAKKDLEDQVALSRALEAFLLNMFEKNFLLFGHRFRAWHVVRF